MQRQRTQQEAMCTQYTNKNEVAIELLRKRKHECSTSRTFVRLFLLDYKRAKQSKRRVVRIQSTLCEVTCEENSRGLTIAVVKIYRKCKEV